MKYIIAGIVITGAIFLLAYLQVKMEIFNEENKEE